MTCLREDLLVKGTSLSSEAADVTREGDQGNKVGKNSTSLGILSVHERNNFSKDLQEEKNPRARHWLKGLNSSKTKEICKGSNLGNFDLRNASFTGGNGSEQN